MQGGPSVPSQNASGLQVVATAKHLVAYDLERSTFNGTTFTRHNFTAKVSMTTAAVSQDGTLRVLPGVYTVAVENLLWEHTVAGGAIAMGNSE